MIRARKHLSRRGLAVAAIGAAVATLMSGSPAAAETGGGCTPIQGGAGILCVDWDARNLVDFQTISGDFQSPLFGVGNPRIHVRILDDQNRELFGRERSWGGSRLSEEAIFPVNVLMQRNASRVCATLYEAGGYMDTACAPVIAS
ncbi:hypothetical protein OG875_28645 [Streptomyces sp. NBC_01498]|uniref:hypothetical protein n=1 Tax=Streptomyces sp. NBC_01498 TaxID=2975870 RepID=UPI002E7AEA5F|nr:hypothetical protein [Streptomyces sp. NBC_01498]WTL28201.1 hypothetical protein OG875_28645 [Streptomyces sp. NBC_01498]